MKPPQQQGSLPKWEGFNIKIWKRVGRICYLIPGKYYSLTKPKDGYVEMPTLAYLTVYYSDKLPNIILLRKESDCAYKAHTYI